MKKTSSGLMVMFENSVVRLSVNPPNTSTIGYARRSLFAIITRARMINMR